MDHCPLKRQLFRVGPSPIGWKSLKTKREAIYSKKEEEERSNEPIKVAGFKTLKSLNTTSQVLGNRINNYRIESNTNH